MEKSLRRDTLFKSKKEVKKKKMKKYILSEKIAKETVDMLQAFIDYIDAECAASGCMCDLRDSRCSSNASTALHNFESGLCLLKER